MAVYADRVRETTTTTGTGAYSLAGAVAGFRTFASAITTSSLVTYAVDDGTNWEVGEGTFTSGSPSSISRTTILASSNSGSAVSWGVGAKNIYVTASASRLVTTDRTSNITGSLTAMGSVGIGTASPSLPLHISKPAGVDASIRLQQGDSSGRTFDLTSTSTGSGLGVGKFAIFDTTAGAARLLIDSTGNVGIGTVPTTSTALTINDATAGNGTLKLGANAAYYGQLSENFSSGEVSLRAQGTGMFLTFYSQSTERMRIDTSGNVGIGATPSGTYKLEVNGAISGASIQVASTSPTVIVSDTTAGNLFKMTLAIGGATFSYGSGGFIDSTNNAKIWQYTSGASGYHAFYTASTERVRVLSNGNMLLGSTTDRGARLDVTGSIFQTGGTQLQITNSPGSTGFQIAGGDGSLNIIGTMGANEPIAFRTGSTERMRLDASGNLGINNTSPSTYGKFAVSGANGTFSVGSNGDVIQFSKAGANTISASTAAGSIVIQTNGGGPVSTFQANGNFHLGGNYNHTTNAGGGYWASGADTYATGWFESSGAMVFRTSTTERVRIDASGNVLVTGAGGIGYGTGSGGAVTQATSKSTGVTLNKTNGQITMNAASLAAGAAVTFTVTNSTVAATDVPVVVLKGGYATYNTYSVQAEGVGAGSFVITLKNTSGGALAEAVVLNFTVIKAVTA